MAPLLVMKVFWLLLVAKLARTAPVQTQQEDGGVDEQSSCTERRVQYWSERSRDAVQRIKDVRFDLDTKIEVLGDLASTKDLEDYTGKLVESSLDSLNEIFQYGALIFECPPEEEDDATVPKKAVIVDRIRQEMLIIMEHLRDILREGIPEQNQDQPQQAQPQQAQPQADSPQADSPQADSPQADSPQADSPQADSPQADSPQADSPQADSPQADSPQADSPQADSPQAEKTETNNQEDDETKRGPTELGLCIARVRRQHQGQDEGSIFQAILSQCKSKREITKDPPSEEDETKRGPTELGLCIARVRQQNQGQDEGSIFQAILSQCKSKREITKDPPSEEDETKRGPTELGLCIARVRQQHEGKDEVSIFQTILSQCQSKREITKDPTSEEDETERDATELGLCIARVRQQHQGQDEASILQTILSQCQRKRESFLPLSETQQNQEDDETKRGAELGLCIARVRQQNRGQDEVYIFQGILSQCQSKRYSLPLSETQQNQQDDEAKRGATQLGLCIALVRQQHHGQDEVSIFQAIMVKCQSKREITKDPPSEDDETERGATELGLCIARVRQQHQGQDEVSMYQAILSQCKSKREITKDPPIEDDETKRGATQLGLCIARVRQQNQGQDEVSIYQAIMVQCQSKREILFEPFM